MVEVFDSDFSALDTLLFWCACFGSDWIKRGSLLATSLAGVFYCSRGKDIVIWLSFLGEVAIVLFVI